MAAGGHLRSDENEGYGSYKIFEVHIVLIGHFKNILIMPKMEGNFSYACNLIKRLFAQYLVMSDIMVSEPPLRIIASRAVVEG